jgi:chlorobactene glucosyltransferase
MKRVASAAFHVFVIAALANALVLLLRNLCILKRLEDEPPPSSHSLPGISVLIPARDEAASLPRCLESLRAQTYPRFTVTVLDDNSEDVTAAIVQRTANVETRFRLLRGKPLPRGWAGKPWACDQLAEHATGDILLFLDADTWLEPDALARTAGIVQRERPGLFSVMPHQEAESFGERLVLPGLYMLFLCGTPLWRLENPEYKEVAAANGQFICIPAETYRKIGGHRAVRDRVVEDLALARLAKSRGYRLMARTAIESVHCRMYRSSREVFDGFSKNAYASFDERMFPALGAIIVMIMTHIIPPVLLIQKTGKCRHSGLIPFMVPALEVSLGILLRLIVSRRMGFRQIDSWMAHLNALAFVGITTRSIWWRYFGRGYAWKGRYYPCAGGSPSAA